MRGTRPLNFLFFILIIFHIDSYYLFSSGNSIPILNFINRPQNSDCVNTVLLSSFFPIEWVNTPGLLASKAFLNPSFLYKAL